MRYDTQTDGRTNYPLESRHADEEYTLSPEEARSVMFRSVNKMPVWVKHPIKVVKASYDPDRDVVERTWTERVTEEEAESNGTFTIPCENPEWGSGTWCAEISQEGQGTFGNWNKVGATSTIIVRQARVQTRQIFGM